MQLCSKRNKRKCLLTATIVLFKTFSFVLPIFHWEILHTNFHPIMMIDLPLITYFTLCYNIINILSFVFYAFYDFLFSILLHNIKTKKSSPLSINCQICVLKILYLFLCYFPQRSIDFIVT